MTDLTRPPRATPLNGHRRVIPIGTGSSQGCVAATPGAAAFFAPASPLARSVMVEHLRRGGVGRSLVERAAELIGSPDTTDYPAMAIVAVDDDGVHVLVHGELEVDVQTVARRAGQRASTDPISSALGDPVVRSFEAIRSVTVGSAHFSNDVLQDGIIEVRDGVVPADGLVVAWETDGAADPRQVDASGIHSMTNDPTASPTPTAAPAPTTADLPGEPTPQPNGRTAPTRLSVLGGSDTQSPRVPGLLCSRQHFNDPAAHFCAHCGIAMHQASFVLVHQPRPALGVLVFDTGEAFEVAGDLSIGRSPADDSLVTSGLARALRPSGDISGLSRVHASLHLDGWSVTVKDRSSLNGTFVWDRRIAQWTRLAPDIVTPIHPGDMIGFGRRTATFQTSIRTS